MVKSLAEATDMLLKSLSVKELKINAMPYHVATLMGVCDAHLHYAHICVSLLLTLHPALICTQCINVTKPVKRRKILRQL